MIIDSGVPVPGRSLGRKVYPFDEMAVGDSFWLPEKDCGINGGKFRAAASKRNNRNRDDKRFIVRRDGEGFRCWRVS